MGTARRVPAAVIDAVAEYLEASQYHHELQAPGLAAPIDSAEDIAWREAARAAGGASFKLAAALAGAAEMAGQDRARAAVESIRVERAAAAGREVPDEDGTP